MVKYGEIVKGKIINIKKQGADVKVGDEIAFLPVREVHPEDYVKDIADYVKVGEEVDVKVIGRNRKFRNQLMVSLKQADRTYQFEEMMKSWKNVSSENNAELQKGRERKQGGRPRRRG
ncbi:S1 RNA-binding domain-containing protein [Bacillus bombysepticus]|uniref:S1 RNA-binding domain-containing protein n=1 Tax=Bacillus bombysepticus TaxID=658666 RepID=UPI00301A6E5C